MLIFVTRMRAPKLENGVLDVVVFFVLNLDLCKLIQGIRIDV